MSEQDENKITAIFLSEKENKIKWHHSRWFWGIVVGTLLIWGIIFFDMLYSSSLSRLGVLKNLSFNLHKYNFSKLFNKEIFYQILRFIEI